MPLKFIYIYLSKTYNSYYVIDTILSALQMLIHLIFKQLYERDTITIFNSQVKKLKPESLPQGLIANTYGTCI